MKNRYRLYRRKLGGVFYVHDSETGNRKASARVTELKPQRCSTRATIRSPPQLNLQTAKAYLAEAKRF
jgi:hypothetical protein